MKLLFALIICLSSTFAQAQQQDSTLANNLFGGTSLLNGWTISLSVSPRFSPELALPGARVEVDPLDVPISERRFLDTISVLGEERIFQNAGPYAYYISPSDANFWFGTQLRVHRELGKGFQFSLGLHYDRIRYTTRSQGDVLEGIVNTIGQNVLYPVAKTVDRNIGLVGHFDYHVRPDRRIHPFLGMGLAAIARKRTREVLGFTYTGDESQLLQITAQEDPRTNSIINIDVMVTGGLLVKANERMHLGLTVSSYVGGAGIFGAQLRYAL